MKGSLVAPQKTYAAFSAHVTPSSLAVVTEMIGMLQATNCNFGRFFSCDAVPNLVHDAPTPSSANQSKPMRPAPGMPIKGREIPWGQPPRDQLEARSITGSVLSRLRRPDCIWLRRTAQATRNIRHVNAYKLKPRISDSEHTSYPPSRRQHWRHHRTELRNKGY